MKRGILMKKDIIILTKSDKRAGYCIAGIDVSNGEWIRLVSSNEETENAVPMRDIVCSNGDMVEIYDIVEVDIVKPMPTKVQPENYLYNENTKWVKKGKSSLDEVITLHGYDCPEFVFGNTDKELTEENVDMAKDSLLLLKVSNPRYNIKVFPERTVVQLDFFYRNCFYSYLKITQKDLKRYYETKPEGKYTAHTNVFVFSLTDKYKNGKYYKVVAQALV